MDYAESLKGKLSYTYEVTKNLAGVVEESELDWKPQQGKNWMTVGQLLKHLADGTAFGFRGAITGKWEFEMPEGAVFTSDMLPPAEELPAFATLAEFNAALDTDFNDALKLLDEVSDEDLHNKACPVPWDQSPIPLGARLYQMIDHLSQHKGQLFYYLKLQEKDVNTSHLWGM